MESDEGDMAISVVGSEIVCDCCEFIDPSLPKFDEMIIPITKNVGIAKNIKIPNINPFAIDLFDFIKKLPINTHLSMYGQVG